MTESFDAALAEVFDRCKCDPDSLGSCQYCKNSDRLAAGHNEELRSAAAEVGELQLDNVNLRKGWQHQVNAVNAWADRCIEQEDRAVAAEARAETAEQNARTAVGLLREVADEQIEPPQTESLIARIDAFLAAIAAQQKEAANGD